MDKKNLHIISKGIVTLLLVLVVVVAGCIKEDSTIFNVKEQLISDSSSVVTLTSNFVGGFVNLSVDAPENSQLDLWIDLNGDGARAQDGSEEITILNNYSEYRLAAGLNRVSIYGGITYLACASNEITAIDISGNPYLKALDVSFNSLKTIDVSQNSALTNLDCSNNNIVSLDVSKNSELVTLWSFNNELLELNLLNNPALVSLDCSGNNIKTLEISQNRELVRLVCYNNQLTSLNISQNQKINRLWLYGNLFAIQEAERISSLMKEVTNVDLWLLETDL